MRTLCLALVVAAVCAVGCGGPKIDPKWEEAATTYLNEVEILARFDPTDEAGFKERYQREEESLIRVPKRDEEPMATLHKSLKLIASGCTLLQIKAEALPLGIGNRTEIEHIQTELVKEVNLVRSAIAKGEAYLVPKGQAWFKK